VIDNRAALSEFLRSRRARLQPADTGLPDYGGRRRVPGLRREELAMLAGVSTDYYVRLEQGRLPNVSDSVLDAVCGALRLTETERVHLYNLAKPGRRPAPERLGPQVRPQLRWLLDSLGVIPALIFGRHMDLLAWNRMATVLLGVDFDTLPPEHRNMVRLMFLEPSFRDLWLPWEGKAKDTVGLLRIQAGMFPDDPRLARLVGELSVRSPEFRRWWADHQVSQRAHGQVHLRHPVGGEMALAFEALIMPDSDNQVLLTYTPEPGSPSEARLRLLASGAKREVGVLRVGS
jgi:transcriptional regulator with XRE-family HTH domain